MRKRRGLSVLGKCSVCVCITCVSVGASLSMSLYVYWQLAVKQVIFLTCVQSSLFTATPLRQGRMWTLITQILWHTWKFTSYPCALSSRQSDSQASLASSPSFLPHLFLYFWLSVLLLAGPLWSSRSPAAISSWWWWTTSVTAACSSQSPWTPLKSCISFTGQRLERWGWLSTRPQCASFSLLVSWVTFDEDVKMSKAM